MKKNLIAVTAVAAVIAGSVFSLSSCKSHEKIDMTSIHTTAATTVPETMAPETTQEVSTEGPGASDVKGIEADVKSFIDGKLSIEYPEISNLSDSAKADEINKMLKSNALSVIDAYQMDAEKDTLSIKCTVISIDSKQITVTYTGTYTADGSAYPSGIFYTNMVNLVSGENLNLSDYAAPFTMAGYVLSEDVVFSGLDKELEDSVMEYRSSITVEDLTKIFLDADFPLKDNTWPQSFSYENQGDIYFSMPVPHALGDYVIVKFTPTTK